MYGFLILIILLGFPTLEIFLLVRLAELAGWWLGAWLLMAALAGWALIRGEDAAAIPARLIQGLQSGHPPSLAMLFSLRYLLAGLLLIFPGVISDALALILLLLPRPPARRKRGTASAGGRVIEGEWRREDER
jgi:UPF0716 protein FxsA